MGNISVKLNLRQLKNVVKKMKRKDGSEVECLVLPIQQNNFFVGEKGIYLDMSAWEIKNKQNDSKDTHLIKQSLPKELFDSMSEEEKHAMPVIGHAIVWSGHHEAEPVVADIATDGEDDLPF